MKILILGGTGAMGKHLSEILSSDHDVYITTRRNKQKNGKLTYIKGDAHEDYFLNTLLISNNWDAIIDFMAYTTAEFEKRVFLFLDSTLHYFFLSSSRVFANSNSPITEDSSRLLDVCEDKDYLSTDEYALAKARQENLLRLSGRNNWTIIRPYITYSENRFQLSSMEKEYWLYRALKGKTILFSKDVADKYTTLTYGYDVARGISALIGKKESFGEAFNITCNECYRWSDILSNYLDVIEKKTGRRPNVREVEKWIPEIGGGATQIKWDRLYNRSFDNTKLNKFIDTKSFSTTLVTMANCLSDFIDNPTFLNINWENEAKKDRLLGEWTNLSSINGFKQKIKYLLYRFGVL